MEEDRRARLKAARAELQERLRFQAERDRIAWLLDSLASAGVGCNVVHEVDELFAWLNASFPTGRPAVDWQQVPTADWCREDDEGAWLRRLDAAGAEIDVFRDGGDPAVRLSLGDFIANVRLFKHGYEFWVRPASRAWLLEWSSDGRWNFARC